MNRASTVPLHRQLRTALRDAILDGRLEAGERLLSSRELQRHLGVSRNTVIEALAQLHAEGYLTTLRGVGTFVARGLHQLLQAERHEPEDGELAPSASARRYLANHALASNLRGTTAFRPGLPALDLFPAAQFKRCFQVTDWTSESLDYSGAFGYGPLREAISRRLQQTRGVACSPEHVVIAGGAQASFSLIARVLLDRNDAVIVEDPGYPNVRATFAAHGARIIGAPIDDEGIDVASFVKRRAKLVYVTPSHQYPSGVVMSLDRRLALLGWASENDGWIVEDDYDSEFNYTDRSQPALQGLGNNRRVIYVGTFSKTLSPALRVSYLVIPSALRAAFQAAHQVTAGAPDTIVQAALARFMNDGYFGRHITKMRKVYDDRRRVVAAELTRVGGSAFRVRDSRAGLHFIVGLPDGMEDAKFSERVARHGVVAPALSKYFINRPTLNGIVVGYAATSAPSSLIAVRALADALIR